MVGATEKVAGWTARAPAVPLSHNNLGQVVHTYVPLSPSSIQSGTGQGAVMSCAWEGNRRFIVALAMRRMQLQLQAHGIRKGDKHPAYTPHGAWHTLPYLVCVITRYVDSRRTRFAVRARGLFMDVTERAYSYHL